MVTITSLIGVFGRLGAAFAKDRELSVILGLHHGWSHAVLGGTLLDMLHDMLLGMSLGIFRSRPRSSGGGCTSDLWCAWIGVLV